MKVFPTPWGNWYSVRKATLVRFPGPTLVARRLAKQWVAFSCSSAGVYSFRSSQTIWKIPLDSVTLTSVEKQLLRIFGPEIIRINSLINIARSAVSKNRGFFLAASAAKFWKRDTSSASERASPGFFGEIFGCSTPSKKRCQYTRIHSLLVNGVVTASGHALWRDLSNKVIWVLGQVKIC